MFLIAMKIKDLKGLIAHGTVFIFRFFKMANRKTMGIFNRCMFPRFKYNVQNQCYHEEISMNILSSEILFWDIK